MDEKLRPGEEQELAQSHAAGFRQAWKQFSPVSYQPHNLLADSLISWRAKPTASGGFDGSTTSFHFQCKKTLFNTDSKRKYFLLLVFLGDLSRPTGNPTKSGFSPSAAGGTREVPRSAECSQRCHLARISASKLHPKRARCTLVLNVIPVPGLGQAPGLGFTAGTQAARCSPRLGQNRCSAQAGSFAPPMGEPLLCSRQLH